MVTLEAWAMGLPVLVNGQCEVLHGQVVRSNAGLYYSSYEEFAETVRLLEGNRGLRAALGANGRQYFRQHYAWPVIEQKYLEMFQQLQRDAGAAGSGAIEPLPGWLAQRRRRLPPAQAVLARAQRGPVMPDGTRGAAPGAG